MSLCTEESGIEWRRLEWQLTTQRGADLHKGGGDGKQERKGEEAIRDILLCGGGREDRVGQSGASGRQEESEGELREKGRRASHRD